MALTTEVKWLLKRRAAQSRTNFGNLSKSVNANLGPMHACRSQQTLPTNIAQG